MRKAALIILAAVLTLPVATKVQAQAKKKVNEVIATDAVKLKELKTALEKCTKIAPPTDRLGCYDKITDFKPTEQPKEVSRVNQEPNPTGNWQSGTQVNPLDDSQTHYIALSSDESKSAVMYITCQDNQMNLAIDWGRFVKVEKLSQYDKRVFVTYRIGKESAERDLWSLTKSEKGGVKDKKDLNQFITKLVTAETFVVQAEDAAGWNTLTLSFNLNGMNNAIKPIAEKCHLNLPK